MKVYYVTIGKNQYKIEIGDHAIKINGETVSASLVALREYGIHLFKKGFTHREVHVKEQGRSHYVVNSVGSHAVVNVEKKKVSQPQTSQNPEKDVIAPLPGQVLSIHVQAGDQVEAGQVVITMESMKMQMVLHAPADGIVVRVETEPGKTVAKGDILVAM